MRAVARPTPVDAPVMTTAPFVILTIYVTCLINHYMKNTSKYKNS
jgi:hypothetical protein